MCLTASASNFNFKSMTDTKTSLTPPRKDQKRADALRQNLLKRKQQTRARKTTDKEK